MNRFKVGDKVSKRGTVVTVDEDLVEICWDHHKLYEFKKVKRDPLKFNLQGLIQTANLYRIALVVGANHKEQLFNELMQRIDLLQKEITR